MISTLNDKWTIKDEQLTDRALQVAENIVVEIACLRNADVIVMETNSSVYKFTLTDPEMKQGWLSGGLLEAQNVIVKWSGTVLKNKLGEQLDRHLLCRGGRAIFHILRGDYPSNFLVTSTILGLSLQRKPD